MTMKVMPVVHARTFNLDFKTGKLLVAPDAFTEDDSLLIYNIAKESTRQREMAPIFGRYVIYGNKSYAVVGRTVRFLDLYTACGREPKYCHVDKENGRTAYGFVGLMIPKEQKQNHLFFQIIYYWMFMSSVLKTDGMRWLGKQMLMKPKKWVSLMWK